MKLCEKYSLEIVDDTLVITFGDKIIKFNDYINFEDEDGRLHPVLFAEHDGDNIEVGFEKDYELPEIRLLIEFKDGKFIEKQITKVDNKYYKAFGLTCLKFN